MELIQSHPQRVNLDYLPSDLLMMIFEDSSLKTTDLASLACVNRSFYFLIKNLQFLLKNSFNFEEKYFGKKVEKKYRTLYCNAYSQEMEVAFKKGKIKWIEQEEGSVHSLNLKQGKYESRKIPQIFFLLEGYRGTLLYRNPRRSNFSVSLLISNCFKGRIAQIHLRDKKILKVLNLKKNSKICKIRLKHLTYLAISNLSELFISSNHVVIQSNYKEYQYDVISLKDQATHTITSKKSGHLTEKVILGEDRLVIVKKAQNFIYYLHFYSLNQFEEGCTHIFSFRSVANPQIKVLKDRMILISTPTETEKHLSFHKLKENRIKNTHSKKDYIAFATDEKFCFAVKENGEGSLYPLEGSSKPLKTFQFDFKGGRPIGLLFQSQLPRFLTVIPLSHGEILTHSSEQESLSDIKKIKRVVLKKLPF